MISAGVYDAGRPRFRGRVPTKGWMETQATNVVADERSKQSRREGKINGSIKRITAHKKTQQE